jgi:hypothetical protein
MKTKKKRGDLPLENLAEEALKEAVAEVIAEHKLAGYPLAVWRDGRVVHLPAVRLKYGSAPKNTNHPRKNKIDLVHDFPSAKMKAINKEKKIR